MANAHYKWRLALDLCERLTEAKTGAAQLPRPSGSNETLRRWMRTPVFRDETVFARFLRSNDVSSEQFGAMLERGVSGEDRVTPPEWVLALRHSIGHLCRDQSTPADGLGLVGHLLEHFADQLRQVCRTAAASVCDVEAICDGLIEQLEVRLHILVRRVLALEVNAARLRGQLAGETPRDRFASFARRLSETTYRESILDEYPVLERLAWLTCANWLDACSDFCRRFAEDHELVQELLGRSLGRCSSISGHGDCHQSGRTVLVLTFEQGGRVVYKPRSLAVEEQFQGFVRWLNSEGQQPALPAIRVVNRGLYGWSEYVEHSACSAVDQVQRFYQRQGAWLAIAYVLGGTDFHFDNVVANGEMPVLIDLEALFRPSMRGSAPATADELALMRLGESVFATSLLPTPSWSEGELGDTSGIGGASGGITAIESLDFAAAETDSLRLERRFFRLDATHNRPVYLGSQADPTLFVSSIEEGLEQTYRFLCDKRPLLLSPTGPLSNFESARVRALFAPTAIYQRLLHDSFHPSALIDGLERELVLCQIWGWPTVSRNDDALRISELRQLRKGDIPYFSTTPRSVDVVDGDGVVVPAVHNLSGLTVVEERLARLDEKDLEQQRWLIRTSMATLQKSEISARRLGSRSPELVHLADSAAERLITLSFECAGTATWYSCALGEAGDARCIELVGSDLYDGLPGIALFLAYAGRISGRAEYVEVARSALKTASTPTATEHGPSPDVGAFSGLAGLMYVQSHLFGITHDEEFRASARRTLRKLMAISRELPLDIVGGSAGVILCLLTLHDICPDGEALEVARLFAEPFLASQSDSRAPWHTLQVRRGFAHGISGIAYALARFGNASGENRYVDVARNALRRERVLLEGDLWTDPERPQNRGQSTWCHGAAGLTLSRLAVLRYAYDAELAADARMLVSVASRDVIQTSDCLCHGTLGNLDIIRAAASHFPDLDTALGYSVHVSATCQRLHEHGWMPPLCDVERPGLMTGLAGVGLGLLRLARPSRVPSVLLLDPPVVEPA